MDGSIDIWVEMEGFREQVEQVVLCVTWRMCHYEFFGFIW